MTSIYSRKQNKAKQYNSTSSKLIIENEKRIEKLENQMDKIFRFVIGKKIRAKKELLVIK